MLLQVIGEGLFDVQNHAVDPGVLEDQSIEHIVDILRVFDSAVEIRREPINPELNGNSAYVREALIVPVVIVATKLDLEAFESVTLDPIGQQNGIAVFGFVSCKLGFSYRVLSADKMPDRKVPRRGAYEKLFREISLERNPRVLRRLQKRGEIPVHELTIVRLISSAFVQIPVSVVKRDVEGRTAN
jgi:hypothetical protein